MRRREFCQKMLVFGSVFAASPLIKACSQAPELLSTPVPTPTTADQLLAMVSPTPLPSPSSTMQSASTPVPTTAISEGGVESSPYMPTAAREEGRSIVALVKTRDRRDGVKRALSLLGINPANKNRVLLKPNFNSADPPPGSTHLETLQALIEQIYEMGAASITVGDRSGMGNTRLVMEQLGIGQLSQKLGFDVAVFDDLTASDWIHQSDSDFHWSGGFSVPRILIESDCVIQTCNLKTHQYGGHFTLSLKNSVGLAAKLVPNDAHDYMRELHNSIYQRLMIAEINTSYQPSLIVLDGVDAFVTGGPAKGKIVESDVILAGTDPIAIDAVGVAILRLFGTTKEVSQGTIFEQEQIARAVELGLGIDKPAKIDFLTADSDSAAYAALIQKTLTAN